MDDMSDERASSARAPRPQSNPIKADNGIDIGVIYNSAPYLSPYLNWSLSLGLCLCPSLCSYFGITKSGPRAELH